MAQNRRRDQAVYLGPGGAFAGYSESSLAYPAELGKIVTVNDKTYQLVKVSTSASAPAPTNGVLAFWNDKSAFVVSDSGDSEQSYNGVAGVYVGTVTAGSYGFIQIAGEHSAVTLANTSAVGSKLVPTASTAGNVTALALGTAQTYKLVGVALAVGSGGTIAVDITLDDRN